MDKESKESFIEIMTNSFEKAIRNIRMGDIIELNGVAINKIRFDPSLLTDLQTYDSHQKLFIKVLSNLDNNAREDFLEMKYIGEIYNTKENDLVISITVKDFEKIYFEDDWFNAHQLHLESTEFYFPTRHTFKHLDVDFSIKIANNKQTFWVRLIHFTPILETDSEEECLNKDCYGIIMNELDKESRYNFLNFVHFKIKNIYYVIDSKDRNEYESSSGLLPTSEPYENKEAI
jgi:hypothetical protein